MIISGFLLTLIAGSISDTGGLFHRGELQNSPSNMKRFNQTDRATEHKTDSRALVEEFPWVVGLRSARGSFFCSGFLIQPDWAVTTSRCLMTDFKEVSQGADEENTRDVIQKVVHPNHYYSSDETHVTALKNDVGLLFLQKMFPMRRKFHEHIHPIAQSPIAMPYVDYTDQYVAIYGYGNHEVFRKVLPKKIRLLVGVCKTDGMYMATFCQCKLNQNVEASAYCSADSGGPVVVNKIVVGLATLAPSYCQREDTMAFASLYEHLPWIHFTIKLFETEYGLLSSSSVALDHCLVLGITSVLNAFDNCYN